MAAWQPVTAKSGNEVQYELYCGKQRGKKKAHGDFFVFSNNSSVCLVGKYLFKVNDNTRTKSKEVVLMSILSSLNRYFSCRCCSQLTLRRLTVILKFLKSRALQLYLVSLHNVSLKRASCFFDFVLGLLHMVFHSKIYFVFSIQIILETSLLMENFLKNDLRGNCAFMVQWPSG